MTLTELVVTVAIAAVLMAIAVPAAKRLTESLQASAGAHGLINAALSNARAIAVREGTYAGVRFQRADEGKTYLVFIRHDFDGTGYANGFRAVEGRKAIALPEDSGFQAQSGSTFSRTFSIVFSAAGKLVIHPVRFNGKMPVPGMTSLDDGGDSISVNSFVIFDAKNDSIFKQIMVSPYTGELIGD